MVQVLPPPAPKKNIWGRLAGSAIKGFEEGAEQALVGKEKAKEEELKHQRTLELLGTKQDLKSKYRAEELAGKTKREEADKRAMAAFADKLEMNNPNNPLYRTIADVYRSDLSPDAASHIVRDLAGVDPFKVQQQKRLQLDSVLKRYNSRIKEIDEELKNVKNPNSTGMAEYDALKAQRAALRAERDQLLDFRALNGLEDEEIEEEEIEEEEPEEEEDNLKKKVRFDPKNKKHMAVFEKFDKKFNGDRKKVNAALAKRFTL